MSSPHQVVHPLVLRAEGERAAIIRLHGGLLPLQTLSDVRRLLQLRLTHAPDTHLPLQLLMSLLQRAQHRLESRQRVFDGGARVLDAFLGCTGASRRTVSCFNSLSFSAHHPSPQSLRFASSYNS